MSEFFSMIRVMFELFPFHNDVVEKVAKCEPLYQPQININIETWSPEYQRGPSSCSEQFCLYCSIDFDAGLDRFELQKYNG